MMVAPITSDPSFDAGTPEVVFEGRYNFVDFVPGRIFDLSPDGTRFLVKKPLGTETNNTTIPLDLVLVQNWTEELTRLVPTNP